MRLSIEQHSYCLHSWMKLIQRTINEAGLVHSRRKRSKNQSPTFNENINLHVAVESKRACWRSRWVSTTTRLARSLRRGRTGCAGRRGARESVLSGATRLVGNSRTSRDASRATREPGGPPAGCARRRTSFSVRQSSSAAACSGSPRSHRVCNRGVPWVAP